MKNQYYLIADGRGSKQRERSHSAEPSSSGQMNMNSRMQASTHHKLSRIHSQECEFYLLLLSLLFYVVLFTLIFIYLLFFLGKQRRFLLFSLNYITVDTALWISFSQPQPGTSMSTGTCENGKKSNHLLFTKIMFTLSIFNSSPASAVGFLLICVSLSRTRPSKQVETFIFNNLTSDV